MIHFLTRGSTTVVLARLVTGAGAALMYLQTNPNFEPLIREVFEPRYASAALLVLGILTEIARSRTLNR